MLAIYAMAITTISRTLIGTVIAGVVALLWRISKIGQRPKGYPPGPPTLPLIGNLHQMPKKQGHLQFQKWAKEFGPVYSLMLGTQCFVVLNSDQAIKDLLDKRSAIYSSRPDVYLGQEILSGGLRVLFMVCAIYVSAFCWEEKCGSGISTLVADNSSQKGIHRHLAYDTETSAPHS